MIRKLRLIGILASTIAVIPSILLTSTGQAHAAAAHSRTAAYSQAAASHSAVKHAFAAPDFTCPSETLCLFQDSGFTGLYCELSGTGITYDIIGTCAGLSFPWGSFNNNRDYRVIFYSGPAGTGSQYCYPPNDRTDVSATVGDSESVRLGDTSTC
jgi:hypothetical protein